MLIGIDANEANVKQRFGSNQYAFQVLWQLYKQDKKNSYFIFLKNQPLADLPKPTKRWQYQVLKPGFLWTQWRLPLSLYFNQPQPNIFFTLGHYSPRFSPIPTMIAVMDLAFLKFPESFLKKDLQKLKAWTKYSVKQAAHIITISAHTKSDINKVYQIPKSKITVAYPAINQSTTPIKSIKSNYLLYLGTLQPRKNLINLVKAFSQIQAQYPQLKLIIAGKKGWLYQSLFNLVKKLKLNNRVIFKGFVSSSEADKLIKNAKLFILPSLYEGFGIPVVKAMSLHTPILVSNNSSLKEIVQNTGSYIEPPFDDNQIKQGIIRALSLSEDKNKQLTKKAKIRVQQFNWAITGKKILEVINDITP